MPLSSASVGTEVTSGPILVSPRVLLAYAAALDMNEPRYMDDARPGGIEGPPFLCTRFEWSLQRILRVHPSLKIAEAEARRGVHFLQDARFLAPLRAGMTVEARGIIREVRAVRAGALIRYRFTIRDLGSGDLLVDTSSISIYRDVAVDGEPRSLDAYSGRPDRPEPMDLSLAPSVRVSVPRTFAHIYTECADIWNPIHTERAVALAAGLPDIILHGTAVWALAGREVLAAYGENGAFRLARLAGRFTGNVFLPDAIEIRHHLVDGSPMTILFDVRRGDGTVVLAEGRAELVACLQR